MAQNSFDRCVTTGELKSTTQGGWELVSFGVKTLVPLVRLLSHLVIVFLSDVFRGLCRARTFMLVLIDEGHVC